MISLNPTFRGGRWLRLLGLCVLGGSLGTALAPEARAQSQEEARAIFLYNFARFVEWPEAAFAEPSTPVTIAVIGDNAVARALERYVKGKDANGREIVVRALDSAAGCASSHITFVGHKHHAADVFAEVGKKPVLTVGEEEDFITSGGVIRLFSRENKVFCAINTSAATAAGLKLGEKLLKASS